MLSAKLSIFCFGSNIGQVFDAHKINHSGRKDVGQVTDQTVFNGEVDDVLGKDASARLGKAVSRLFLTGLCDNLHGNKHSSYK